MQAAEHGTASVSTWLWTQLEHAITPQANLNHTPDLSPLQEGPSVDPKLGAPQHQLFGETLWSGHKPRELLSASGSVKW